MYYCNGWSVKMNLLFEAVNYCQLILDKDPYDV